MENSNSIESKIVFDYPPYPFEENKIPINDRLKIVNIPAYISTNDMIEDCFPHVRSSLAIYISGISIENWNDTYECLYIYCCEFRIKNFFVVWNDREYFRKEINDFNWKNLLPIPDNFYNILNSEYKLGIFIPLVGISVRNTLLPYHQSSTFEMYVSQGDNGSGKLLSGFNSDNYPAFDIIKERNLTVFCHSTQSINISKDDHSLYISNLLKYCTGHSIRGAVFNIGRNIDNEQGKYIMMQNIVNGIRRSIFRADQVGTCKFLLKTPCGKGNEILSNIFEFISFCTTMLHFAPEIKPFFAICIDTCNVYNSGLEPYNYLKEILKYLPVELVHLNDSIFEWGKRKDKYCTPGSGMIPWPYLMKVSQICHLMNIPMITQNI